MKILSNKKWELINQQVVDLQLDLNDVTEDNAIYQEQVNVLTQKIKSLQKRVNDLTCEQLGLKKEVSRLKSLCSKNGVNYRKAGKTNGRK